MCYIDEPPKGRAHSTLRKLAYCAALFLMWRRTPSLRFGQLLVNATGASQSKDLFYVEDATLLNDVKEFTS